MLARINERILALKGYDLADSLPDKLRTLWIGVDGKAGPQCKMLICRIAEAPFLK